MDLILFGIQGSGKGTQGKIFKDRYNMAYFETGAELRRLSKEDSDLGSKVKEVIEAGRLVPNEIVMEIVEDFMNNLPEGKAVIFDGVPRKQEQAETMEALLNKEQRDFKAVIIDISQKEALARLTTRRVCENCKNAVPANYKKDNCPKCEGKLIKRTDDNEESIKTRLKAYFEETMPVINMFEEEGRLIRINGEQTIDKVSEECFLVLDPIFKNANSD